MHQKETDVPNPECSQAKTPFVPVLCRKEIDALKRACLYSTPPNLLGYCGPGQSWQSFQKFISEPTEENALAAKEKLCNFNALFPYLELIAKANNKEPFDPEVIEAYWLGNKLLENISHNEIQKTILSFQKFGLPRPIAEKKAAQLPEGMLPHHSMHVLYVNFISQKVKPIVQNLSNCMVQWAKVIEVKPNAAGVKGFELFSEAGELKLREKEKTVQNPLNFQLNSGDFVSLHWGNIVEKISAREFKSLKSYTFKNLKRVNSSLDSRQKE
ncbi:MAG: DUF6390 family protein [archaeon]